MSRRTLYIAYALIVLFTLGVIAFHWPAHAQSGYISGDTPTPPRGPFAISADQNGLAWRIDQSTGAVSYCIRDTVSNDPALLAQRPPICSAWGK